MKLDLLRNSIADFAKRLASSDGEAHLYKYQILSHFRDTWSFDTDDFAGMFDRSLTSNVTRRWWKREHYRPKESMLLLIPVHEQYARQAFQALFHEGKDIANRIDSFRFYCDELLRLYRHNNRLSIDNNHYQDATMQSLYLGGMYPQRYTLYPGLRIFSRALEALGAKTSEVDELPRYFKLCGIIYSYLIADQGISGYVNDGVRPAGHLLLVHEYLYHIAGVWHETTP